MTPQPPTGPASDDPHWPELEPFRRAAAESRLLLKLCKSCGQTHYYPRSICPYCFSGDTVWQESRGLGTVYTYSIQRRVPQPFVIAYVSLDDGPTLMTHIVDMAALEDVHVGMRVQLMFRAFDGGPSVPVFKPLA